MSDASKRIRDLIKAMQTRGKTPGGLTALAGILSKMDKRSERRIFEEIQNRDPNMARSLQKQYFRFEDLMKMEDAAIRKALAEIDHSALALALKGTPDDLQQKIFRNLSRSAANFLKDDMEIMGPQPRAKVEEAQDQITQVLRNYQDLIL